jgi:hypothetical protein
MSVTYDSVDAIIAEYNALTKRAGKAGLGLVCAIYELKIAAVEPGAAGALRKRFTVSEANPNGLSKSNSNKIFDLVTAMVKDAHFDDFIDAESLAEFFAETGVDNLTRLREYLDANTVAGKKKLEKRAAKAAADAAPVSDEEWVQSWALAIVNRFGVERAREIAASAFDLTPGVDVEVAEAANS